MKPDMLADQRIDRRHPAPCPASSWRSSRLATQAGIMAKEKWTKTYVKTHIRATAEGYHCPMPDLVAYPAGPSP
jgi:hypothetical protein